MWFIFRATRLEGAVAGHLRRPLYCTFSGMIKEMDRNTAADRVSRLMQPCGGVINHSAPFAIYAGGMVC